MRLNLIVKKFKIDFSIYFFLGIISATLPSIGFYFTNSLIEAVINNKDFLSDMILIIFVVVITIVFVSLKTFWRGIILEKIMHFIREEKTNSLMSSSFDFNLNIRKTENELTKKISKIMEESVLGIFDIVNNFVLLSSAFTVLFLFHWILGLVIFVAISFLLTIVYLSDNYSSKHYNEIKKEYIEYNKRIKRTIKWRNGLFLLQKINFFNNLILKMTLSTNSKIYEIYKKTIYYSVFALSLGLIFQLSGPIISALLAYYGFVSISVIAVSGFLLGIIYSTTASFSLQLKNFKNSKAELNNLVFKKDSGRKRKTPIFEIEFINFNPTIRGIPVFEKDINIRLIKNSKIHLVGDAALEKSSILFKTLINNTHFKGEILINKKKANRFISYSKIIFLNKNPHIFKGSLRENFGLFSSKYSDFSMNKIKDIVNLPIDLNKQISSTSISESHKQKIALARALLTKPDFIFMDEALCNIPITNREGIEKIIAKSNIGVVLITGKKVGEEYEKISIN